MAVNVDFSGVFHNALPNAYIRNVSLMEGEVGEERVNFDETPQPFRTEKNMFGKVKLKTETAREKIVNSVRGMTVDVELAIKDGITKRGTGVWFDDENTRSHLKIRVLLCTNKKAGTRMLNGGLSQKERKEYIREGVLVEKVISMFNQSGKKLAGYRSEKIGDNMAYVVPYSATFSIGNYNPRYLSVFAMTFLETGNVCVEKQAFNQRTRTDVQGNATAEVLIDNGKIKKNAYLLRTEEGNIWAGPTHANPQGKYSTGAFEETRGKRPLIMETVSNIVVSDFRLLRDAEAAALQLFPTTPSDLEKKRKGSKRDKTAGENKNSKKEAYVSRAYHSKSPSNTANFAFHFDFDKLIQHEAQYGKLLEVVDEKAKAIILSKSRIRNVRVMRHRVQKGIREGEVSNVSFEERTELVAMASEEKAGFLPRSIRYSHPDSTTIEAEPKLMGAIKEIDIQDKTNIRSFAVSDYDLSRRTDGAYQYSIQFDIEDGTVSFVAQQLKKLQEARVALQQHYNLSMQDKNFNSEQNRSTRRFEKMMKRKYRVPTRNEIMKGRRIDRAKLIQSGISSAPWVRTPAIYADVLFNLTDIGSNKASEIAALLYEMSNPYNGNPSGVLSVLKVTEALEGKIKDIVGQKQRNMDEWDYSVSDNAQGSRVSGGKAARPAIELNHRFKKVYDSDILKGVGYEFLAGNRRSGVGIRRLSVEQFRSRMLLEAKRHFTAKVASGAGKEEIKFSKVKVAYLAPAVVRTGKNESYNLIRNTFQSRIHHNAMTSILSLKPSVGGTGKDKLNPNVSFSSAYDDSRENDITREEVVANLMDSVALASVGVSFHSLDDYKKKGDFDRQTLGKGETGKKRINSITLLGPTVKMTTDTEAEVVISDEDLKVKEFFEKEDLSPIASAILSQFATANDNLFAKNKKVKTIKAFDPANNKNILERFVDKRKNKTKKDIMSNIPNQIKSLFLTKTPAVRRNWIKFKKDTGIDVFADPRQGAMLYFNYQMLNRVEVFVGYRRSDITGERMLRDPRFALMSQEILDEAIEKNRTLLCRMSPYRNAMLGFGHNERLSLPIFDEHFLVSSGKRGSTGEEERVSTSRLFINRISHGDGMNNQGMKDIRTIVETCMLEDTAASEYVTTAIVQQPMHATKFGTEFGTGESVKPEVGGMSSIDVLSTLYGN